MENSNNNKWMAENPLFKNKDQRYYYDFGTGNKIEREDVKQERDALLGSTSKPQNQEKDDFLEGFNDPYGEKREQERQQKEQERKERLANIRANAGKRNWYSQSTADTFLDRFNGILSKREQRVKFPNTQLYAAPSNTRLMFQNTRPQAKPQNADLRFPNTQLHTSPKNDAFLEGFNNPNGEKETTDEGLKEFVSETVYEPIQDIGAHISLHNTAHKQYPWMRFAGLLSPVAAGAIGNRITSSSAKVAKHKDIINDVSNRYNVPREIIGGIIFKEQLTKSLPDTLANVDTFFIRKDKNHSTGLGAIFPETARAAWAKVAPQKELPKTNEELQYKLTYDSQFNIETIAAVLIYEAKKNGIISDVSEASNLTTEQWRKAIAEYNGSDEYARKVYEYLPYVTELID